MYESTNSAVIACGLCTLSMSQSAFQQSTQKCRLFWFVVAEVTISGIPFDTDTAKINTFDDFCRVIPPSVPSFHHDVLANSVQPRISYATKDTEQNLQILVPRGPAGIQNTIPADPFDGVEIINVEVRILQLHATDMGPKFTISTLQRITVDHRALSDSMTSSTIYFPRGRRGGRWVSGRRRSARWRGVGSSRSWRRRRVGRSLNRKFLSRWWMGWHVWFCFSGDIQNYRWPIGSSLLCFLIFTTHLVHVTAGLYYENEYQFRQHNKTYNASPRRSVVCQHNSIGSRVIQTDLSISHWHSDQASVINIVVREGFPADPDLGSPVASPERSGAHE